MVKAVYLTLQLSILGLGFRECGNDSIRVLAGTHVSEGRNEEETYDLVCLSTNV